MTEIEIRFTPKTAILTIATILVGIAVLLVFRPPYQSQHLYATVVDKENWDDSCYLLLKSDDGLTGRYHVTEFQYWTTTTGQRYDVVLGGHFWLGVESLTPIGVRGKSIAEEDIEKEFTILNGLAFTLMRDKAQKNGMTEPCWLCMSKEAKSQGLEDFDAWAKVQGMSSGSAAANSFARNPTGQRMLREWREKELYLKSVRENEKNPRAFFYEEHV